MFENIFVIIWGEEMKLLKKITSFTLVLAMLLGAQAAGLDIEGLYASSLGGSASKNHPGIVLQSIDTKQPNPDYVSLGNGILQRNSTQKVTVGLSLDMASVSEAGLRYKLEGSEKVLMQSSSDIKNGYITFDIDVDPDASPGKYSLLDVQLKSKDGSALNSINLKEMAVSYEVVGDKSAAASVIETGEPAAAQISETSAVVGVDGSSSITGEDIGKAIDSARKAMQNETGQTASSSAQGSEANTVKASEGINIVLDPGHGGDDPGAVSGSYLEKNLNLKIAQYAKEELETYTGVTVGMTRTEDTYIPLAATRADAAQQQEADILVSLHNNSAGNEAAGAEVYVSVLKAYNQASSALGNLILDQLTMLGLYDRGVKTRPSEDGTIFSITGELADYYGIIRESAYRGFPGIIIEHCFMSNPAEAQAYLSSEAKLKQLGVADAQALADYYGLVKKDATTTSVNLSAGKLFTSPVFTNLSYMTDGNRSSSSFAEDYPAGGGLQYVQMDLEAFYDLSGIKLWHYFSDGRKYKDVIVQVSSDPAFAEGVTTVYNNDTDNSAGLGAGTDAEYAETSLGHNIQFDKVNARYVRLYSNGSSMNSSNHYVEVEVYGLAHPTSVSLSKTEMNLEVGAADALTASVMPLNTTYKGVAWTSSDTSIATVSPDGVVTGVKEGAAAITATTADGGLKAACQVKVTAVPKNLSAGRLFTSSVFKGLGSITDGSKSTGTFADDYPAGGGLQYVQMDLGAYYDLSKIKLWHYYGDGRKYNDVIVRVSNDPAFAADVTTVYNNDGNNSAGFGTGSDAAYAETSA
ncbi:MAG: hypothetical protein H6Q58_2223, partial [Firmicutes bacterium]|nr:hypothetical protein [Bacillota bacterium]